MTPFPLPELSPHRHEDAEGSFARFTREAVLLRIRSGRLTWEEHLGFQDRNACVVELFERGLRRGGVMDATICVFTGDALRPGEPDDPWVAAFARRQGERRPLVPNFNFVHHRACGIGDWDEVRQELISLAECTPWEQRDPRVFFAGAATNPIRSKMAAATRGDDRFLIDLIDWNNPAAKRWSLQEHVGFRWLLNMNGWGYSGRLHYLLATGAGVIQLRDTRPAHRWEEFWTPLLEHGKHLLYVDYRRWEPGWVVKRRIMRAIDQWRPDPIVSQEMVAGRLSMRSIDQYALAILDRYSVRQGF